MIISMAKYICHSPVNMLNLASALFELEVEPVTRKLLDEKVERMLYTVRTARKGSATEIASRSLLIID